LRKIIHQPVDHNTTRTLLPAVTCIVLALGSLGCQDNGTQDVDQTTGASPRDCAVTIDTRPWSAFHSMAARMSRGEAVPEAELNAYGMLPAVESWRRSLAPNVPQPGNVANWLQTPWLTELGKSGKRKMPANRIIMGRNYLYSYNHAAIIDSLLDQYTAGPQACDLADLVARWLSPGNIPSPLVLNVLPAMAEIRMFEDEVYLDTGVLVAGGLTQTNRSIATLLYRNLEAIPGTNPLEAEGEQAIAECLRVIVNEGIAGWIEQTTQVSFDREHPSLCKVRIVPTDFYRKAQQTIDRFADQLPKLLADPATMTAHGSDFARGMAGANSFSKTGIAAAELIVARLGEERLHEIRGSVPDFWAAFQEAALLNDNPAPALGTAGVPLYESLTPLAASLYEPLHALMERYY